MSTDTDTSSAPTADPATTSSLLIALAWLLVGIPLAYGLWQTLVKASALFTG